MKNINDLLVAVLKELWEIRNPQEKLSVSSFNKLKKRIQDQYEKEKKANTNLPLPLTKKAYFDLTTARNKILINADEQNRLRKTVACFFGLSVGSHAALTWMTLSRADTIKIIDPDTVSATNLNRLRVGWSALGESKSEIVKNQLADINPFARIIAFNQASTEVVNKVYFEDQKPDIIIDEIDSFEYKILLRKLAKKSKIPLISAADVGDNVVLDIERYDLDPGLTPFLGRIKEIESINFSSLTEKEKKKLIIRLVGFEKNSERMINSLFAIGASIKTWPQLGTTATISGGIIATTIKKITLGENVKSGRYYFSLDDILVNDFYDRNRVKSRNVKVSHIKHVLKI